MPLLPMTIAAACTCGTWAGTGRPILRQECVCWIFWSTDLLQPAQRFAFWSEVVCRTFTMLDCRAADRAGFRAKLCSRSIAGISVARVEAHVIRRRQKPPP